MQSQPGDWRTAYQNDGFVVVPKLLDPHTLLQLRERLEQVTRHPEQVPAHLRRTSSSNGIMCAIIRTGIQTSHPTSVGTVCARLRNSPSSILDLPT
jgi:hypothetical protein